MLPYTDWEKEQNRRDQANTRARKKGLPEPFPKVDPEVAKTRKNEHDRNLEWALAQDATGKYYGDEIRSCVQLLGIYEGNSIVDKEVEDEIETADTKRRKKILEKENRLNPSQYKISIQAIEYNGILLEPNCAIEFRSLKEVDEVVSFRRWLDLRGKARKNLFWLGRLLGKGLFHSVHQYMCDQFVQKNFDGLYFPEMTIDDFHEAISKQKRYANDETTLCRELILLESRGSYKSTINGVDSVQWLINCPDIRIMYITAFRNLSKKLAKEIKRYFYLAPRATPTAFQLLFPEYVLTGVEGRSETPLNCPAAIFNQKEPNLWVTSMESSFTGDHCDIRKADDIVDPKNSADEDMRADLKFAFDGTDDILDQWGFSDVTGTRYFTDDWYGTRALPNKETGEVAPYRYSCRGCWSLLPEDELAYKSGKLTLKDIFIEKRAKLTFPYKLSWTYLRNTYNKKGERSFKNQQLNEATDEKDASGYVNHFTEEALRAHCIPASAIPKEGTIYITWDWALSDKKTSDFSAGAAILVYKNVKKEICLCVLEIDFDKWKDSELVFHILSLYAKWRPERVVIENSNGSGLLKKIIDTEAARRGITEICQQGVIYWKPVDISRNAKRNRIKSLELLLTADRLFFVNGIWLDETFKQLTKYTGEKSTAYRKDDIPDCLSFIVEMMPSDAFLNQDVDPQEAARAAEMAHRKAMNKARHDAMFSKGGGYMSGGLNDYGTSSSSPTISSWQASKNPSPSPINVETQKPANPVRNLFSKLFGGNGMRG